MTTILEALENAEIFADLAQTEVELIASIGREMFYQYGDVIFEQGTISSDLYIIAAGRVDIQVTPDDPTGHDLSNAQTVATLRRGQSFGEMAMISEGARSATTRAAENNTHLIIIPREKLLLFCDNFPTLGYKLMRNMAVDLAFKLRQANVELLSLTSGGERGESPG